MAGGAGTVRDYQVVEFPRFRRIIALNVNSHRSRQQSVRKAMRPAKIVVDGGGVGHGAESILRAAGLPIMSVQFQQRPTRKPDLYLNMRALMWVECRDWICNEEYPVSILNNNLLIEDLTAPNYWEIPKYKIETKDDIKKRTGRSTDFADALCLTFAPSKMMLMQSSSNGGKIDYDPGFYGHYE